MSDDARTSPPEETPPARIELSPTLQPSSRAAGRVVLYAAALLVAAGYFWFRGTRPASLQPVFLNSEHITRIEWPGSRARLVSAEKGWRVEHESWGSAMADSGKVLELLQRFREVRGVSIPRIPDGFSPAGEMRVAERTLRFYRSGADAVVESGSRRYLLPGFSVDSLFPDPVDLVQRRPLILDASAIIELTLPVLTADGEKHYNIKKSNQFYYVHGAQLHLANYNTILSLIKNIQDVSFRSLLLPPPVFPEKPDFSFKTPNRTWRLARFSGSCPDGETAWAADSGGEMLAGCLPERFMARLMPSLPTLLEPRLLPSPPDGKAWNRIRVQVNGREIVDVRRTPEGWRFPDGSMADEMVCSRILQAWQNTAIFALVAPEPGEIPDRTVIFSDGSLDFPVALLMTASGTYAARGQEGRRARIPESLAALVPADRASWADRRVFPAGCRQIVRTVGTVREVFALETPPEGKPAWRVLEPLDLPYPSNLEEKIENLCNLRAPAAAEAEIQLPAVEETAPVRWEVTDSAGKVTALMVRSDGLAVRLAPDGTRSGLKPDEPSRHLLLALWHDGIRPPWNLAQAKKVQIRLAPDREIRISFHDPHWLWTEGDKKRILTELQARTLLDSMQKVLEQAVPDDLQPSADCSVKLSFFSDAGLPLEYCVENTGGRKRVFRMGIPGHARVPEDFPEAQLPVFP